MPTAVMNVLMNRRQRKRVQLSLVYAMIRFMLRARQPLKLLVTRTLSRVVSGVFLQL